MYFNQRHTPASRIIHPQGFNKRFAYQHNITHDIHLLEFKVGRLTKLVEELLKEVKRRRLDNDLEHYDAKRDEAVDES